MLKSAIAGLLATAAFGLSGCADYVKRRDTIWLGAGEAVQTNIIAQQIDPWPVHARRINAATDGERAQRAIERYRNPRSGAGPESRTDSSPPPTPGGGAAQRAP